ncbi:MAG: ATP synthase subunit b [Gammaproteobacteria bacterium]|nr:ATP synthase subunit b [Gammaproteobacteria bacterium]
MNINITLIGQTIAFAVFVWFCMKYIWPPIMNALEARKKEIADGLAAAEKGRKAEDLGKEKAIGIVKDAKSQAQEILGNAEKRRNEIIEEAKTDAKTEGERLLASAQAEIEQEINRAREELRGQVATLVVSGAARILDREVDDKAHGKLIDDLVAQL